MELRDLALAILRATTIADKLRAPPAALSDGAPGEPLLVDVPSRPPGLEIHRHVRVPSIDAMSDRGQRARILHALANHELQAVELFAWALLAFPDAPADFRRGLVDVLRDEQIHTRLYIARLRAHGAALGDFPVSGYFWSKIRDVRTPVDFICTMSLTFENANLDHTVDYARAAREAGDEATARVIDRVHDDEIEHVRFGWTWLRRLKDDGRSMVDAYRDAVTWPLRPALARGPRFHRGGRRRAGLDDEFIRLLEQSEVDHEAKRRGSRDDT